MLESTSFSSESPPKRPSLPRCASSPPTSFFPITRFPHGAEIAWWTPLYHAVRLSRGLCQGPLEWAHAGDALWLAVVVAIPGDEE